MKRRKQCLVVVNTVLQLIFAVHLKRTLLRDMDVDIQITDHTDVASKYVTPLRETGMFREVSYVKNTDYKLRHGQYKRSNIVSEVRYVLGRYSEIRKRIGILKSYDYLFASSIDYYVVSLFDTLKHRYNSKVRFCYVEDGLYGCRAAEVSLKERRAALKDLPYAPLYRMSHYGEVLHQIDYIFSFFPELSAWEEKHRVVRIPRVKAEDAEFRKMVNHIFCYTPDETLFEGVKAIFFEESFVNDGLQVNDQELVTIIGEKYGREHVMVKLHPRDRKNRFSRYHIFPDQGVPWEVVKMNCCLSGVKLVSISSGSVMYPYLLFGDRADVIILQKLAKWKLTPARREYQDFLRDTIFPKYPKQFHVPENIDELKALL